jgi:hypothetical protein
VPISLNCVIYIYNLCGVVSVLTEFAQISLSYIIYVTLSDVEFILSKFEYRMVHSILSIGQR